MTPRLTIRNLVHLLSMSDSQYPVGNFSFSNGLESAAMSGIVHDAETLRQYAVAAATQAAFSDGVASLHAFRAALAGDYDTVLRADEEVILCKMNDEARQMVRRMGRKMAELNVRMYDSELMTRFLDDLKAGRTPGTYPVAHALACAAIGIPERDMYVAQQFGVVNMILGAALRMVRVSHYDSQKIMFDLAPRFEEDYSEARDLGFEDMRAFVPGIDMMASMHEKGTTRMFMN